VIAVAVIAAVFAAREQELDVSLNIRAVFIGIEQLAFAAAGCNGPGHHCTSQTCTDDQGRAAGTARGDVAWSGRNPSLGNYMYMHLSCREARTQIRSARP
jgi:hypothetical protein